MIGSVTFKRTVVHAANQVHKQSEFNERKVALFEIRALALEYLSVQQHKQLESVSNRSQNTMNAKVMTRRDCLG
jgi:hypothetical protein